jgi:hypothetical protein
MERARGRAHSGEINSINTLLKKICQWGTLEKIFHQKSFFLESFHVSVDSRAGKTLGESDGQSSERSLGRKVRVN